MSQYVYLTCIDELSTIARRGARRPSPGGPVARKGFPWKVEINGVLQQSGFASDARLVVTYSRAVLCGPALVLRRQTLIADAVPSDQLEHARDTPRG